MEPTGDQDKRNPTHHKDPKADRVQKHQGCGGEKHKQQSCNHLVPTSIKKFLDGVQIAGLAGDNAPGSVLLMKLQGEFLGMDENSLSKIKQHILVDLGCEA